MRKTPVIEYQIPKTIFTNADSEANELGKLLTELVADESMLA